MFVASAAVRASTVTSTVSGAWLTAANWSDAAVPMSANAYVIDGETMDTPDAGGTFSGGSLTITSGILRLARSTTGTNTTSIPNFTMAGGSMYFYGNNYNATWNFQSAIAFTAGTTSTLNINRGNYIMDANLNGALSGSNNLTFSGGIINFDLAATAAGVSDTIVVGGVLDLNAATTVAINRLAGSLGAGTYVLAQAASITGSVVLGSASGQVTFNLGSALGASEYHINGSWSVNNNAAGGLDSAAAITLQSASAALNLNQPITNPALILTANSGGIALGGGTSSIGSFVLNSVGTVTLSSSGGMLTATDFDIRQGTLTGGGTLGGTASLTKSGAGTATILTNNTYRGATTVLEGTLAGTGSAGSVTTVTAGATLAPGGGIGTYACAGAVFDSAATFAVEVDTTTGTTDKLVAGGAVTIHPAAILTLSDLGSGGAPNKLVLIDYTGGSLTGVFAGYPEGSSVPLGGAIYVLSYSDHSQVTLALPGYAAWAAANAPGESAAMDHDHDGVSNGIEYFMGQGGSSFTANPGVVNGKVSWPRGANYGGNYGTDYRVQTSTDLIVWTDVPVTDTAHLNNGSPLEYTLPPGDSAIFVRLIVTGP